VKLPYSLAIVVLIFQLACASVAATGGFNADLKTGVTRAFDQPDPKLLNASGQPHVYKIVFTKWVPKRSNGHVLIYNHGLESNRTWAFSGAEILRSRGFTVYAFDRIGSGESSPGASLDETGKVIELRGHISDFTLYLETIQKMKELAKAEHPRAKLHIWGNSFGGKLVTAYALGYPMNDVESVLFTSPGVYQNEQTMPLRFTMAQFNAAKETDYLPSPIYEVQNDNGAGMFTSNQPYFDNIKNDKLALRDMTKSFFEQSARMSGYIEKAAPKLNAVKRFYMMIDGDQMMDNVKMFAQVRAYREQAIAKFYRGGHDHRHLIFYTTDREQAFQDLIHFLLGKPELILSLEPMDYYNPYAEPTPAVQAAAKQ
jgi:alpha-beta hydrolase superfamily lysophospholipase